MVQIESRVDEGTKLALLFPRSNEPLQGALELEHMVDDSSPAAQAHCRVLLVEDDVQVASLTSAMLAELGCDVIPVTTAQAALEELSKSAEIGLVLSDIMMPGGMDGIELVRQMRQRNFALPVLLVSGFAAAAADEAEEEGITLVAKPYSVHELAQKIRATAGGTPAASGTTHTSTPMR
jgi:CheY-like chemotaxis protein